MSVTLSYLTLAGCRYGDDPQSGMTARAKAARSAGFDSIGVNITENIDPKVLTYARVPELEWADLGQPVTRQTCETIRRFAGELGVTRVNAGVCGKEPVPWETAVKRLRRLAQTGVTVAVEPVSFGSLASVRDVLSVVSMAGEPTVGMLFDVWHAYRDSPGWQNPWGIGPETIAEIQVCGIQPSVHDVFAGSQDRPGVAESAVDISRWLTRIRAMGCDAPLSYERPRAAHGDAAEMAQAAAADIDVLLGPAAPLPYSAQAWCKP